mmetsp:Transcript_1150/g.2574  ORF Transcript_1150/g.2574 Transcript_1150/m.2574 type:complete len:140 (+) Transcript_1150:162-581(+)
MCRREGREQPKHHRRLATPEVLRFVETVNALNAMAPHAYQSSLSRPPYCNSCGFHHGPTYTQCSSASTPITTPSNAITTDDIEAAITELSPHSPQGTDRSTLSSVINSLTGSTAASVLSLIEVDTAPTDLAASFDFEGA